MKTRGRPREYGERQAMYLRLPIELHERVLAEAERRDVSVNQLLTLSIERLLPQWESQDVDEFARVEPMLRIPGVEPVDPIGRA